MTTTSPLPTPDSPGRWALRDVTTTPKGARSAALVAGSEQVIFSLHDVVSPFGASSYGDRESSGLATRLSLDLALPPRAEAAFEAVDEWCAKYLAEESQRLLRKRLPLETVQAQYKPLVRRHDPYPPTLRCKFNTQGRHALRCWTPTGERREAPEDWTGISLTVRAHLAYVYFMGASCGFVVTLTDVMLRQVAVCPCPFPIEREEGDGSGGGSC